MINKSITKEKRVHLGRLIVITEEGADFSWKSVVKLKKDSIAEWVFRKYNGPEKNRFEWYAVTLSRNQHHQSGLYITRQNYQVLLRAFQVPWQELATVKVHILAVGKTFTITINDKYTEVVTNDELAAGRTALVPINSGLTVLRSHYTTYGMEPDFFRHIKSILPTLLFWFSLPLLIFYRWEKKTSTLSPYKKTWGLLLIFIPLWAALAKSYMNANQSMQLLIIGISVSVLILFLLTLIVHYEKKFFSPLEIIILLICLEFFLRIDPLDKRLQENPIQANIPPQFYWYRAASSRRWNSFINYQEFRNGRFKAPFSRMRRSKKVRIMCLGSSSTANGYPKFLEQSFHEAGFNYVEVIDGGVPGTTTTHVRNFYDNLLVRFDADIVTLCLIRNDMKFQAIHSAQRIFDLETSVKGFSPVRSRLYHNLNKIMLYRLYRFYLLKGIKGVEIAQQVSKQDESVEQTTLNKAIQLHISNVRAFIETARRNHQMPMLILEPFFVSDGFDTLPEDRNKKTVQAINTLALELKVPVIDVQKIVHDHRHDLIFIDDVHQNRRGKKFLGHVIYEEMKDIVSAIRADKLQATDKKKRNESHKKKNMPAD